MNSGGPLGAASALQKLLWAPTNSLTAWAGDAACAVLCDLPIGATRAGYKHLSTESNGMHTHELVELQSGLVVHIVYERTDGTSFSGFCQPWPDVLSRFVEALLHRNLLGIADPVPTR